MRRALLLPALSLLLAAVPSAADAAPRCAGVEARGVVLETPEVLVHRTGRSVQDGVVFRKLVGCDRTTGRTTLLGYEERGGSDPHEVIALAGGRTVLIEDSVDGEESGSSSHRAVDLRTSRTIGTVGTRSYGEGPTTAGEALVGPGLLAGLGDVEQGDVEDGAQPGGAVGVQTLDTTWRTLARDGDGAVGVGLGAAHAYWTDGTTASAAPLAAPAAVVRRAPSASPPRTETRCASRGSKTLLRTEAVRVFRDGAGRSIACRRANGGRTTLAGGRRTSPVELVERRTVAFSAATADGGREHTVLELDGLRVRHRAVVPAGAREVRATAAGIAWTDPAGLHVVLGTTAPRLVTADAVSDPVVGTTLLDGVPGSVFWTAADGTPARAPLR